MQAVIVGIDTGRQRIDRSANRSASAPGFRQQRLDGETRRVRHMAADTTRLTPRRDRHDRRKRFAGCARSCGS